jgi:hypothetical protein
MCSSQCVEYQSALYNEVFVKLIFNIGYLRFMETTRSLYIEPSVHIDITLKIEASAIGRQHERATLSLELL